MLELFLPIDEKRHNSFIYHHTDRHDDQLDRRKILACQNEFSKKKSYKFVANITKF